jgi:ATP-dependent DNA helicase DinG
MNESHAALKEPLRTDPPGASALQRATAEALSAHGPVAEGDAGFIERAAQQAMAAAVAQAIDRREPLVAEAGTGVGKTFAYLVPLLLSGRRALVSTATKALQDQLFLRDLPRLLRSLKLPARLALLKGRSSYLCLHRLKQSRDSATLPDRFAVRALARIEQWATATRTGDLAEIDGLDDRSPVIPLVTSTRDNCLGTECPSYRDCHVMHARRDAMAADLVVVNHHLFFADIALRDTGVAELLPTVDAAVFDEAHQLVETGVQFLGVQLGTSQMIDFARDLLAVGLTQARGLRPWPELAAGCEHAARDVRLTCAGPLRDVRGVVKLAWDERSSAPTFQPALQALSAALQRVIEALADLLPAAPDFGRLSLRASELSQRVAALAAPCEDAHVRWIDVGPRDARLVQSPLDIRELLVEQRASAARAWIFTSATLGDDANLSWFSEAAALEEATKLRVDSPFDYRAHARVWVPAGLPKPNDARHPQAVGELAGRLAGRLRGRTFVLTTTLRVLEPIAQALRAAAQRDGPALDVLVQGTQPRRALLQRFLSGPGHVLVGSQSFWEGIDVPGDALQCVLIDKLPFPPPNDPLVQARSRALQSRGRDAFNDYFVAEAAVSLKQGAGRLIRHEDDRGLLVIGDVRMRQMGYGKRLLRALPPMTPVADEAQALAWLDELAADH